MNPDTTGVLWNCLSIKKLAYNMNIVHLGINQVRRELLCYVVPLLTIDIKLSFL
jgi:hypothetical protein